jgi:hypothetical protein
MKALTLRKIPKDVFDIVVEEQTKIKITKGTNQFSFESTVYNIVRKYKRALAEIAIQEKGKAA